MKSRVYLDTTVIGYFVNRRSCDIRSTSRQDLTKAWWAVASQECELLVSQVVIDECARGNEEAAKRRVGVCMGLNRIEPNDAARTIARLLIERRVIPVNEQEDAAHIAIATTHDIDFLVSWNFSHLVGASAKIQLRSALQSLGYSNPPIIATPEELLEDKRWPH